MRVEWDKRLARGVEERRRMLREAEEALTEDTLRRSGIAVNDVVRDVDTGAAYMVEGASVSVGYGGGVRVRVRGALIGRRVYKTGRRAAASTACLSACSSLAVLSAEEAADYWRARGAGRTPT